MLRLFHTELEAVYEEFNRALDSDNRQAYYAMMEELFKKHPYGTQTTIGTSEHLKNPSMEKIHAYFKERYKPNNMAIVLSGDVNPDSAVAIIEEYFGDYEKGDVPTFEYEEEDPITEPIVKEVTGVESEFVTVGYRLPGAGTPEAMKLEIVDGILSNGKAGLIDLNLNQKQTVIGAYSTFSTFRDYSVFQLSAKPRQGQTLDEVADLLREQLEKVKKGEFEDWMPEAVVNDKKLSELRGLESNWSRAGKLVNAFVYGREWSDVVNEYDEMEKITKAEISEFAKKWFNDNYVQINKVNGESNAVKVEKPQITPVEIDRESKSDFYAAWDSVESGRLQPVFIDYEEAVNEATFDNGLVFNSIANETNELFSLYYILDMGSDHDLEMALAVEYLPYLGTEDMTAEELQKELFKLGVSFDVFSSRERSYVVLSGLDKSMDAGIELFEKVLANVVADEKAYTDMVDGMLKSRQDAMKSKGQILYRGMMQYAQYGEDSPMKHILSQEELAEIDPQALVEKLRQLTSYEHKIFYYGPRSEKDAMATIEKFHKVPDERIAYPEPKKFEELEMTENKVYFTNYDMVQSELMMLSKGEKFDASLAPQISLYNQYFGSGLSSIVFQEIRESKALAYSAYSGFTMPNDADDSHYVRAYIGAQVDKLPEAADAMLELMNEIPEASIQFETARDAALKQIETNRTTGQSIYWNYLTAQERGIDYDLNRMIYDSLQTMTFDELEAFFNANIKGKNYTYTVIGNEEMIDKETLKKLGDVEVLSLEEIFGYPAEDGPKALVNK